MGLFNDSFSKACCEFHMVKSRMDDGYPVIGILSGGLSFNYKNSSCAVALKSVPNIFKKGF